MKRPPRDARGGMVYHVLNRAHARMTIFEDAGGHFLTLCRYVERNPLRPKLVERGEDWQSGSARRREHGSGE